MGEMLLMQLRPGLLVCSTMVFGRTRMGRSPESFDK